VKKCLHKIRDVVIAAQLNIQLAGEPDQPAQELESLLHIFPGQMKHLGHHQIALGVHLKVELGQNLFQQLRRRERRVRSVTPPTKRK